MRFDPFISGSYTLGSVTAACQRSLNLYPEIVEGVGEKGKYRFVGTPGHALFADLAAIDASATPVRGLWSGGGRLFVAAGAKYLELNSSGVLVGSVRTIVDDSDHTPVKFLANGNQLLIVASGNVYCDNGSGPGSPLTLSASLSGKVDPSGGQQIAWKEGDVFSPDMVGGTIVINGHNYTVDGWYSDASIHITADASVEPNPSNYTALPALKANAATYLDGYYIVNSINGYGTSAKAFRISALNNGLSWDALDFGVKEGYPDNLVALLADHQELWLFGSESIEVWRNTGNADFPFQRDPSAVLMMGCACPNAVAAVAGRICFVSADSRGDWVAYATRGFSPERISTHAVEEEWRRRYHNRDGGPLGTYLAPHLITGYARVMEGHACWVICVGPVAWVYDFSTGFWHEEATNNEAMAGSTDNGSAEIAYHAYVPEWNKHIVGGGSKLYRVDLSLYADSGNPITRQRVAPHIVNDRKRVAYHNLALDMEVGSSIGGSTAPRVALDWSNDGGQTFGTARTAPNIRSGNFVRALWRQLGAARDRVFRVTISGTSKVAINNAHLELTGGDA